jgi:dynein heavy chain, axonemal
MNKASSKSSLGSQSASTKKTRRKIDYDNFEWTDDAISKFEYDSEQASKGSSALFKEVDGVPVVNKDEDMDHKIARVQYRKKEEALRLERIASMPIGEAKEETVLSTFKANVEEGTASDILAQSLNNHFDSFFSQEQNGELLDNSIIKFPLHLFDSSTFDEGLNINNDMLPLPYSAALVMNDSPESESPRGKGLGTFSPCILHEIKTVNTGQDNECQMYDVELLGDLNYGDRHTVPRIQICLSEDHDTAEGYGDRIIAALQKRRDCVTLLKYNYYVKNMPFADTVSSTLEQEQGTRILDRAYNNQRLYDVSNDIRNVEMNEAREGYESVMNKIIFDANMLSSTNDKTFQKLNLPKEAFPLPTPPPESAVINVPKHNMEFKTKKFLAEAFFASNPAIRALCQARVMLEEVQQTTIINMIYENTFKLDQYERNIAEQMLVAQRALKQQWPTKTGGAIRRIFIEHAEEVAANMPTVELGVGFEKKEETSVEGPTYDVTTRSLHEYLGKENGLDHPVRGLVEKVNFMMSECLFNIVKSNLKEYTSIMEQLCACEITIVDVKSVRVIFPENSIYKTKVLPCMFSVSFQVTAEEHCLNPEAVAAYEAEMEVWYKSQEYVAGEKCPIKKVETVMGHSIEYDHAMIDFKNSVLRTFDTIIEEFLDVPHVQKYVMERIYFPNPKFIASVTNDIYWVKEHRERVGLAMDKAMEPLDVYLGFFRKYEDFINIDIPAYVEDKVKIQRKDPESQEIELVVQLQLPVVQALIDSHLGQIEDISMNLPVTPIECGLFCIEVVSVRELLLDKHRKIVELILERQAGYCSEIVISLDEEFVKIMDRLAIKPETIEEIAELEEYLQSLNMTMNTLNGIIKEMSDYYGLLDKYKFKVEYEQNSAKWMAMGGPARILQRCDEVVEQNQAIRKQFHEDMLDEQHAFMRVLGHLDTEVKALASFVDLKDVQEIANRVKDLEEQLTTAGAKARLFNSRESIFESDVTDYEDLAKINKMFDPYNMLWQTAREWIDIAAKWRNNAFIELDPEEVEKNIDKYSVSVAKALKFFKKADMEAQAGIADQILGQVTDFKPDVPLIVCLRNPGMRDRHWNTIAEQMGVEIMPIENFTTDQILALNLKDRIDQVQKIAESAAKEYQIENALDKMEKEWEGMILQISAYKETGTCVLKGVDDINAILDEQITMTQTIMFSAFKGPFEERIDEWNRKLCCVSDTLEAWVAVQRNWLYLQPIFESADINRQLPQEGKKFSTVDKGWRNTMTNAKNNAKVIEFCDNEKLLDRFKESEILLDQVQKGLSDYLETKRSVFARFYFLSNDELLSILSESKDVKLVQPHLKKCFEGIDKVKFLPDLKIDRIISPEQEEVKLSEMIDPVEKNVEDWMLELEDAMRVCIRDVMEAAIEDYTVTARPKWMQKWPGMCVLNGSQMHWTSEMESLFLSDGGEGPSKMLEIQKAQLADMTILVRGKLSKAARTTVGALTVIDVHARDVIHKLALEKVDNKDNFGWMSQLRYYWDGELTASMVAATRPYGYEYLGNSFRLVITPLTDKCYLTLMGALQMIFGGAPAGPAGTGKTETTKDLAKALAMQCVVFNCSDGLDYVAMGKFFKGLAACGAWACFDEFNRINIEVLSVIGQQIMSIQQCVKAKEPRMDFEGSNIAVSERFAVFITMNPGYAGRSALPDSLQALFRPVAMMVPDYALIGEIMFFAYGFEYAKECGAKMVTTFKLCSEQLSSQPHYDYGMRAVKTVITAAGNLKRAEPDADEMVLLLRALQDVNIPKFLSMDLPLFRGIISDLFPGKKRPQLNYGAMMKNMKIEIRRNGLQAVDFFITKVIELYEMIVVRHGLMLVGPTGGGKTENLHVLAQTLGALKEQGEEGFAYEKVQILQLNPKSITMGQMYGEVDSNTMEWKDGIMSTMYRNATVDTPDRKWIMFNGPVDAIWIENMNTVLDDNKKLCLNSGEIIKMSNEMTMMFEVEDLAVASPATVSRVGIIYMEPRGLGLDVLIQSWLERMPPVTPQIVKNKLNLLFDMYLQPSIFFLRSYLKELAPSVDNNLAESLMRILDCYLAPYIVKDGEDPVSDLMIADLTTSIEPLFLFALTWSVGGTTNSDGRAMFDGYLRGEMFAQKSAWLFPKEGTIYDYMFSWDTKKWIKWMEIIEKYEVDSRMEFSEIIIPTKDSVRNTYLMDLLLTQNKHVLMVGATGTGKTVNISQYLMGQAPKVQGRSVAQTVIPLTITFSANTSANMTQDQLDSKMDKRKKGVYGPAAGKKFFIYVDDLNMPKRETYGAQPPIELLRQWFDQGGWYDRKELTFRKLIDMVFVTSMGPPGGGKQDISPRFLRHFNMIGYVEMSKESTSRIFGLILGDFLGRCEGGLAQYTEKIVHASIDIFDTIVLELLPTPSKSHYTFNLRDLAKIFQGMLMIDVKKLSDVNALSHLWIHENLRVFGDRLTNLEDRAWLDKQLKEKIEMDVGLNYDSIVPSGQRIMYGDFMFPDVENKLYEEIENMDKLKSVVEEYLHDHNAESKQPMPLVMFSDALEHVARIARVLRQPQGNALLLGVGGSGRQSMTKLATYISGYMLASVEIVKGYGMADWREDLKRILMQAGVKAKPTTFLFSDVQIIDERMLEDINNVLNAGDVPNLYAAEDLEAISSACRIECQKRKIPATKLNIFSQYISRVRKNIHLCLAMSPLGEPFRNRLRNFPSLVNCCTIDWFTAWPAEALQSVGLSILQKNDYGLGKFEQSTVHMFKLIHQSVETSTDEYFEMLRRYNYVTPTSYLELLSSFGKLIGSKRTEINTKKDRLQIGLDKLSETKGMVGTMQEELTILQPQLVKTQQEVSAMMVIIKQDRESAAETKAVVEVQEADANEKAAASKAIADDAQRDLDEAIPALEEAVKCLNDLKKSDIDEVKNFKTPPGGVVLTIHAVCIMFQVKPIKKNDPNQPGKKIDDFWEAGKKELLTDAKIFIESLKDYDKDHIPDKVIKGIAPFMEDENFTPKAIEKASKACTAVCMWVRAMHKYHFVALGVAPKRAALATAEAELEVVMGKLKVAQKTLQDVNDKLAGLQKDYDEAVEKLDGLAKKEARCKMQLENADKLIGGLGSEEARWAETVEVMKQAYVNVLGDIIVSAGTISYLGVFTMDFRQRLVKQWQEGLTSYKIPHTAGCDLEVTLAEPVKVRSWQLCNLPSDSLSTQNALIMDNGRRWPLLIDPQGQANRYIRSMSKDLNFASNGMDACKPSDKNFLRTLVNGVQFGRWVLLENISESLDAALEPILLQQKFKSGGQDMIKLGDDTIPYNDTFRFFMTTKLANPHYAPEVQVKVSLLNFTITINGLEEQLLNVVVGEEMPDLAQQKANLVVDNAARNKQLYDIESEILFLLANSKGDILDDTVLIETLAQSKLTSNEIKEAMAEAAVIEKEIADTSELYRPVAKRASLLYFVVADMGFVDPMYQYSLQWFTGLFIRGMQNATPSSDTDQRVLNLNDFFTDSVYQNICRSLFERHKLLFAFVLCVKILQGDDLINQTEYRFLLSGISPKHVQCTMPVSGWLEKNVWEEICEMSGLDGVANCANEFETYLSDWQTIFESQEPHKMKFPGCMESISPLLRLCMLRCLRRDKVELAMQDFICYYLDERFIQPPPFNLKACYLDSSCDTPLIFILSTGSDPNKDLDLLAEEMDMSDRLQRIALGQGQGNKAKALVEKSLVTGDWVMLQNCHLSISWMPTLEMIVENFEPSKINPEFRLWLTSMPSPAFPTSVLQNGVKITKEPPKGIKANLKNTYIKLTNESVNRTNKPVEYQKLLFGLSFFHAIAVERKKFGPLGWNIPYSFNDTDMDITAAQLELYVNKYDQIPYKVLQQLASVVNYGGRITDDKDMRTSDILIADFFDPMILKDDHPFSVSGLYKSIKADPDAPHDSYMNYINSLPLNAEPEVFGMHDNANITCAITGVDEAFAIILSLQPRVAAGAGASREDQIGDAAVAMAQQLPKLFDVEAIGMLYPTDYYESMNTVLVQEAQRYNNLLSTLHLTLNQLPKALKGLVVLSAELEKMATSVYDQKVPDPWTAKGYPSLKPLNPWFKDFILRMEFMQKWVEFGVPATFWISGFFFPQGFLTACLQNYARKMTYPIDTVNFGFVYKSESLSELTTKPEDGCYIHGLFLEGARWDGAINSLVEPRPKELFSAMPVLHMSPEQYRETPQSGIYRCPVYKILTRTGVLSTTGHSTNFVTWIEIPSNLPTIYRSSLVSETNAQVKFCDNAEWVKAGVACFCALRY